MDPAAKEKRFAAAKKRATIRSMHCRNPNFVKQISAADLKIGQLYVPKDCNENLPMYQSIHYDLEDEEGFSYPVTYNGHSKLLNDGWRVFCEEHGLTVGDVVFFELTEQNKFKVYIFRVWVESVDVHDEVPSRDPNIRQIQQALDSLDRDISERNATIRSLEIELHAATREKEAWQSDKIRLEAELLSATTDKIRLEAELLSATTEKEAWQSEKIRLEGEICKLKSQKKELLDLGVALSAKVREFADEAADLHQGFEALNIQ